MANIITFLTFKDRADEAAKFYCSIFPGARIKSTVPYPEISIAPRPGAVMIVELELFGQTYVLLNGGPHFQFTDGVSLVVQCDSQAEIDHYWSALTAGGGEPGPCGWLKDRFGVSWQVNPKNIAELIGKDDPARAKRVMEAVMKMGKLDLATMERAAAGR
ncbi:MAG TPA: VOC family protein [Kofleriaceae bacterium]|nr:VOC family protein [Kofleriaceae bacterium]